MIKYKDYCEYMFVMDMARRRFMNPLRPRNTMNIDDITIARQKANVFIARKMLNEHDTKHRHASETL